MNLGSTESERRIELGLHIRQIGHLRRLDIDDLVNAIHDHQGSRRGDTKNFSNSMFMATAQRPLDEASLELRGMLSLDPAMGKGGYPLLFQTGETANGVTHLVDRQHPHDFFMEMGARYTRAASAWIDPCTSASSVARSTSSSRLM